MCVANRISCFCEAILDVDHLCKADLRCCVAKKVFDDKEKTPKELIIPKNDKRCQDGSNDNEEDEEEIEEDEEEEEVMETSESKKDVKVEKKEDKKESVQKKEPEIPASKRCRGTCVTGFFSLLCDEIDRAAVCPGSGRCCGVRSGAGPAQFS